jgi:Cu/Ag efflux protein CusF
MHNKHMFRSIVAVAGLLISSVVALAHGGMEHIMGTVAAFTENSIMVDTVQHKQVTVLLDPSTKFAHNDAQASLKDLKVGDRVVIHAKRNADEKLVGVTVKWGAASTAHSDHMDTK